MLGGQGGNPKTDACKTNRETGCDKRKGKRLKVTSEKHLEKYQKISDEKNSCGTTKERASKSPPARRKLDNGIGKRRSLTSRIHILLLGHQCLCHGYIMGKVCSKGTQSISC
jgi:hypothetical protein